MPFKLPLAAFLSVVTHAQVTTGSISGYVLDPSRQAIAGAAVRLTATPIPAQLDGLSDSRGFFSFAGLRPGVYKVSATADRFASVESSAVTLTVDSHLRIDVQMPLAGVAQSLDVTARVRATQTESSELSAVIDRAQVNGLPLNRRDFLQLALLTPGVATPVEGSQLTLRGSFAMHANGAREEFNNFLLDGVDNNDPNVNRYALQPPVDAIQEFRIATNSFSAEYGRSGGGQVNVVTRGGSNEFHGFGYEYLRNRHLDARNFFSGSDKPQYQRNQFGAGVGGPAIRDRTFFFLNWDGLRERRGITRVASVPTEAARRGDLSGLPGAPLDPFTRQPFAGKVVPAARIHPVSVNMLKLFPLPNLAGAAGNLVSQPVLDADQKQWNARVDHRLADRGLLTFRYSFGASDLAEPFAQDSISVPGFGDTVRDRGHNALAQYRHTFSPSISNALILGFNRVERRVLQQGAATDVNRLWGVNWLPSRAIDFGYPAVNIAGYSLAGDATQQPIDRAGNTYQLTDNVSVLRGAHSLKFGFEARRVQHNGIQNLLSRGSLSFSGAVSGTGPSDALLGYPSFGLQSQSDNAQTLRYLASNFYAADDWKARPNLTLNFGLRYEYNTPPVDPTDRMSVLNLATGKIANVGTSGISRSGTRPDRNNLAPRAGFAWSVSPKTVIRGGYGVYYDVGLLVASTALYFNPPYFTIRAFFPTQTSLLTLSDPFPARGGITPAASLSSLSPDLVSAYLQHWNLNVQREIAGGALSIAYGASKGTHLIRSRDINQPPPASGDIAPRRPLPAFANIFFAESGGNSSYQSLQASFTRPVSRGFSAIVSYTLSKSIDDASAFLGNKPDKNFPQNSRDFRAERALSSFDQRQRVSAAGVWQLPGKLLRGFQGSVVAGATTGQPLTPILRFDNSNTGNTGGQFGNDRPNILRDPKLASPSADRWFDPTAFAVPARFAFGSAGRNIVTGPGFASVDAAITRRFRLGDAAAIQIEAQAFNLANRTNFDTPERFADEPSTFARVFSAKSPRQIQFSARLTF